MVPFHVGHVICGAISLPPLAQWQKKMKDTLALNVMICILPLKNTEFKSLSPWTGTNKYMLLLFTINTYPFVYFCNFMSRVCSRDSSLTTRESAKGFLLSLRIWNLWWLIFLRKKELWQLKKEVFRIKVRRERETAPWQFQKALRDP